MPHAVGEVLLADKRLCVSEQTIYIVYSPIFTSMQPAMAGMTQRNY